MVKHVLHYIEGTCINCGRARLEEYSNGDIICEKCEYNQQANEYEDLDVLAALQMEEQYSREDDFIV